MKTLHWPDDTRGWRVVEGAEGRTWLAPDGTGYRPLRNVDGVQPDVVIDYPSRPQWPTDLLRELGPIQLRARLWGTEP